jgi:hypothetical protein
MEGSLYDIFEKDVGTWDAEVVVHVGPGAPSRSTGVMTGRRISGGRWLVTDFINETSGFQGHGVYGWDATQGTYVGTWVDDMRSTLTVMKGEWDAATRTMTYRGQLPNGVAWRETSTLVDADTQVFRSFFPAPGGEVEVMTATYRRRS